MMSTPNQKPAVVGSEEQHDKKDAHTKLLDFPQEWSWQLDQQEDERDTAPAEAQPLQRQVYPQLMLTARQGWNQV